MMIDRHAVATAIAAHFGENDSPLDAADAAIAAVLEQLREPSDTMLYEGEGMTDFILPEGTHDNTKAGRMREMKIAWQVMIDRAFKKAPA